jgi:hypothetical protein
VFQGVPIRIDPTEPDFHFEGEKAF